jgi:uncharacterized protein (DUF58 family)
VNDLFPPDFLRAIEPLTLDVRPAPATARAGRHLSRAVGSSLDFRDFRPYTPGDDLRHVDWNVYRRSGSLYVRRFEHPAAAAVYLLLDSSASMFVESPNRFATAARVAAAIASAALRGQDPLTLIPFGSTGPVPLPSAFTGRRRLHDVLSRLGSITVDRTASIGTAVKNLSQVRGPRGVAVIVSDLFDEAGACALTDTLADVGHRLILVQIIQPSDADPTLESDEELIDAESEHTAVVAPTASSINAYRRAYEAYQEHIRLFAKQRAIAHVSIDASADVVTQIAKLFPAGTLHVGGMVG